MAYRRHIVAVRNTTKEAMAQALANANISEIESANGWCWAMASVWTTSGADLLRSLEHAAGPVLLVTTEDGSRWWLHLARKGLDRFSTFHEFTMLFGGSGESEDEVDGADDWEDIYGGDDEDEGDDIARMVEVGAPPLPAQRLTPLEFEDEFFEPYGDDDLEEEDDDDDDEEESPLASFLEDYEFAGAPLPDTLIEALENVPESEWRPRFLSLHAAYIAEALEEFNVPHDRESVLRILTGDGVSKGELESDVGNLWRFLHHLGLGEQFATALDGLEGEEEDDEYGDDAYDPAREILEAVQNISMHPVEDGPAVAALEECPLLARISDGLNDSAEIALVIQLNDAGSPWPLERPPSYVQLTEIGPAMAITFDAPNILRMPKARVRVGGLLARLPNGSSLELAANGEGHRYRLRGAVVDGAWHIDSSSVPLSAPDISAMLDLARRAESRRAQSARDEAEADAIMAAARNDVTLYNKLPVRDGLSLTAQSQPEANALADLFFRHRFRHRWNMEEIEARMLENYRDWVKLEEDMNRESSLPVTDQVIFVGKGSRFLEPDYAAPSVDDTLRKEATDTAALDREFEALGFDCLGALVCERVGGGFLRCYASTAEQTYAVAYFMPYMPRWYDFVCLMDDDTVFTTTSSAMESSIRSLRILIRFCQESDIASVHKDHREGLTRLGGRGIAPAAIDSSLEGIARTMDEFLVRRLGAEMDESED